MINEAHVRADVILAHRGLKLSATGTQPGRRSPARRPGRGRAPASSSTSAASLAVSIASHDHQRITSVEGGLGTVLAFASRAARLRPGTLRRISQPSPDMTARSRRSGSPPRPDQRFDATVSLPTGPSGRRSSGQEQAGGRSYEHPPSTCARTFAELFEQPSMILTSATLSNAVPAQLGIPPERSRFLDIGSPFDYDQRPPLLRQHLPRRPVADFEDGHARRLAAILIEAAAAGALACFTSSNRIHGAVAAHQGRYVSSRSRRAAAEGAAGLTVRLGAGDVPVRHDGVLAVGGPPADTAGPGDHRRAAAHPPPTMH